MQWCCLMPTRKPQLRPSLEQPLVLPASGEPSTGLILPPGTAIKVNCRLCRTLSDPLPHRSHGTVLHLLCPTHNEHHLGKP